MFFFFFFISNGWGFKQETHPILGILVELLPFNKITLKSRIFVLWLESGSWGYSVLQTPALVVGFVVH